MLLSLFVTYIGILILTIVIIGLVDLYNSLSFDELSFIELFIEDLFGIFITSTILYWGSIGIYYLLNWIIML
jgi:hypothetical protein